MFAPRLRSDLELDDTYNFEPGEPLPCPIRAWSGDSDSVASADAMKAWERHTRGACKLEILRGTHFALHEREEQVLRRIRNDLTPFA